VEKLTDSQVYASGNEAVGTVRQVARMNAMGVGDGTYVYRKVGENQWVDINSPLTDDEEEARLQDVSDTSLIPRAELYLDSGFNVLLKAFHGVGKTESIMALAKARGLKMKYFSCSTLDPFTDLVGVPTPIVKCMDCGEEYESMREAKDLHTDDHMPNLKRTLKMVRPLDLDEAEIIFFDEFNRADEKTQNAVFEIIQFRSINGEPLPNLKVCWAAINPEGDDMNYAVNPIDAALLDRFDIFIDMVPRPSVSYMSKFMPKPIAEQLYKWWQEHQDAINNGAKSAIDDYISPRRLMKIGLVWMATKERRSLEASFPPSGHFEKSKLFERLSAAQKQMDGNVVDDTLKNPNIGDAPNEDFVWKKGNMQIEQDKMAEWLASNQMALTTHDLVVEELSHSIGGDLLIQRFPKILNSLVPSHLEKLIDSYPAAKVDAMKNAFVELQRNDANMASLLTNLHKMLDKFGSQTIKDWVKP
jgi:hypothetical protein